MATRVTQKDLEQVAKDLSELTGKEYTITADVPGHYALALKLADSTSIATATHPMKAGELMDWMNAFRSGIYMGKRLGKEEVKKEESLVRVRALRALHISDDDVTVQVVPKGMMGTLRGLRRTPTPPNHAKGVRGELRFLVDWDFHAVGDSKPVADNEDDDDPNDDGPAVIHAGWTDNNVLLDSIEVVPN